MDASPTNNDPGFSEWSGRARGLGRNALRRLLHQPITLIALSVLVAVFVVGALVPYLAPQGWNDIHLGQRWQNHAPMLNGWHAFGTDNIGRDVLVRALYGLHTSELDAIFASLIATLIGVVVGGIAGYRGGWVDAALMRVADMLGIFPALMLLLVAYVFFQPVTVPKATAILAAYLWVTVARTVRASFVTLRETEFVEAARALGASDARILLKHLFPNAIGTVVIGGTTLLGQVVMLEATVEFFGLGVPSQVQPTLGNLIGDAAQGIFQLGLGWWTWAGPAALLVIVLVCANLIGDGVESALSPRSR
jgi:peptide/nickel transport system permease protein